MNNSLKFLTVTALAASLAACGGDGGDSQATGTLSLGITDAPVDELKEVNITVTGVEIKPASGESRRYDFEEPLALDLLALQGGNAALLLNDEEVPAGEYNWVRLYISTEPGELTAVDMNGGVHDLYIPSGAQTGLKLVRGFTVPAGGDADFTIDFDVRKSIVDPQGSNPSGAEYFLKPALRLIDNVEAGTISGTVDGTLIAEACADAATFDGGVYVHTGADQVPDDLGSTNEPLVVAPVAFDGTAYAYTAAFISAGNYTVSYTCDLDTREDANGELVDEELTFYGTQNVTVVADTTTTADF